MPLSSRTDQPLLDFWPQLGFFCLFLGGLHCALWMHGDSRITTVAALLATACLILSRLPYEQFPRWMRVTLQFLLVGISFLWLLQRWENAPMDLCVSESCCLLLCSLFLARTLPDHLLLWGACMGLMCYGSMNSTRPYFAIFFAFTAAMAVFLLYATRTLVLSQARQPRPADTTLNAPKQPSFYWLLHLALVAGLTILITHRITRMPQWNTMGVIPVSFRAMQSQNFPVDFGDWMTDSSQYENTDAGELIDEAMNEGNPMLDPNAASLTNLPDAPSESSQGTGGGFAIGTDLVFRAYTSAKLYWMLQVYDLFDGTTWSRSRFLDSGSNPFDYTLPDRFATVVQKITLYKPSSDYLPFHFAPRWLRYSTVANGAPASSKEEALIRMEGHLQYQLSHTVDGHMPKLPWHYTVFSQVALQPEDVQDPTTLPPQPDSGSSNRLPPPNQRGYFFRYMHFTGEPMRWHGTSWPQDKELEQLYLQMPPQAVTDRMVALAQELTKDADSELEKATILRNYLRENFKYSMELPPVPAGTPPLDYFLFESKQGFCQHFAQALVFLARAAGLRSRLVTGYAPGNYNILSNYYEIYEYHAHAWTQIFVERYGWLTFDGTPPAALNLQNTPAILASTRNAFDKTWTPAIPETAFKPQPGTIVFSRTNPVGWGQIGRAMADGLPGIMRYLFGNKKYKYNKNTAEEAVSGTADTTADTSSDNSSNNRFLGLLQNASEIFSDFQQWLFDHKKSLAFVFIVALFGWLTRHSTARLLRRWWRKMTIRLALRRLRALPSSATARRIEGSLALADLLLIYCHHKRLPACDAAEQAKALQTSAPDFGPDFQIIAQAALQNHFAQTVSPTSVEETVAAIHRLVAIAMPQIDG